MRYRKFVIDLNDEKQRDILVKRMVKIRGKRVLYVETGVGHVETRDGQRVIVSIEKPSSVLLEGLTEITT